MLQRVISEVAKVDTRRGADVLLEVLESEGVQYIFGNPGTTELPLMDALLGAPALRYILALQEASAVASTDSNRIFLPVGGTPRNVPMCVPW